jgi:hypothetical protein
MTTSTTNATLSNSSNANFQAWVNEVYTALVTTCGLTHSTDTGQMAVPCVTAVPGATNTKAGYYIFQFNDTLQSTAPIFIRIDFGSSAAATDPCMWLTVGTATNGAGTISGAGSASISGIAITTGSAAGASSYNSYYCYNATQGVLWLSFKTGAAAANLGYGGFAIYRTVNAAGASTGDGATIVTMGNAANAVGTPLHYFTLVNYNTSAVQVSLFVASGAGNGIVPYNVTSTLETGTGQVFPIFQYKGSATVPGIGITNVLAIGVISEIPAASTVSLNILGSLTMTYLSLVSPFDASASTGALGYGATYCALLLWQ